MKRNLLITALFFLSTLTGAWAQLPGECSGGIAPVAPFCTQTCTLCDDGIDGYVGMNANTPQWEAPPDFCAPQFHSVQWLAFVAGTNSVTFDFAVTECETGSGLQVAIYGSSDCASWNQVSACDPAVPLGATISLTASGLEIGGTYFFVIDGNGGDVCEFQINVTNGSTSAPDVVGTPAIAGPTSICTGGFGTYSVTGVDGAGYYNWTLNGVLVGTDQLVDVDFPNDGTYTLCVTPGNSCYGDGENVCTTITVGDLPTEVINARECEDDLPFVYQGFAFSEPGLHEFSYFRPDGCEQPVQVNLTVIPPIPPTELQADICQGQAYFLGGTAYTQTGYHTEDFITPDGCDSTVNLDLTVHAPEFTNLGQIFHCSALGPYDANGTLISEPGQFTIFLQSQYGCDSTVVGFLELTTPGFELVDTVICEGEVVTLGNFTYTSTGNYQEDYEEPGGCTSTFQLELLVYDPVVTIDTVVCSGESITVGNSTYSASGSYTDVLEAQYLGLGCDSTVNLNLTVLAPIETNISADICEGESYTFGPNTYTTSGTYSEVFTASNGCDSTVYLDLTVFSDVETTLNEAVCFGGSFTVGDSTFVQTGNYEVVFGSALGCDSTVTLNLTVKDAILTTLNESICDGSTFEVGSDSFDAEGSYEVVLTAADGCDSTVALNLTLLENPETELNETVCEGESFTVGGTAYNQTGTYIETLTAANGCDSTVTLNLTVQPPVTNNITRKICTGQSTTVGNQSFSQPGSYTVNLTTAIGCDSIVNLTLTIEDVIRDTLVTAICEGESFTVAGNTYNTTGFYDNDFVTASGCDSVFSLDLTVVPVRNTLIDMAICDGESVLVGGNTYTTNGSFQETLTSVETGCDSVVSLNLTILDVPETFLFEEICAGESFGVGSSSYVNTGVYRDTLQAANGCDSIVQLDLAVLEVPETILVESICEGDSFGVGSSEYGTTGNYTDTLQAANGCDSIVKLELTVLDVPETFLVEEICEGENIKVGSNGYTSSGAYTDTLQAANGCDSIVYLDLTVFPNRAKDLTISICNGSSFTVGPNSYDQSGTYVDTLQTLVTGCDSVVTLKLTVTDFYEINLDEEICEGESFTVGSSVYNQTGAYSDSFISSDGCDSIVNLNLTVIPLPRTNIDSVVCDGESVTVGGTAYASTGVFVDTLASAVSGCDSIITLNLTVNEVFETILNEEICDGESFQVGDSTYTQTGQYVDVLTASNGCDSTVRLALTVYPIEMTNLVETICFGENYLVGSSQYSASGTYQDVLTSAVTGCDSIVNLDLTVRPEVTTSLQETVCFGDDFTVGASTYTASGTYSDTLTAVTGCDSIITLALTVREEIRTSLQEEICDGESFGVGNSTYTSSGSFADTLTSLATGCDSIVTLDLTVFPIPQTSLTEEICDGFSFAVGDSTYTQSGIYQNILTSTVTGCDSIVSLDLTVHPIEVANLTETLCFGDDFTVGSSTYTQSGIYQDILTSTVTGCDSIVNLDLTIRPEVTTSLQETVCFGDDFTVGASTYTASGTYSDTLTAVTGCDSIITLALTVREEIRTSLQEEICGGESFGVGNSTYTSSGVFADTLTSLATGCDSIVTLDLTVFPIPQTSLIEEICEDEFFTVGASSYNQTGVYADTLTAATGCDSIITLDLTVHPIEVTNLTEVLCSGSSFSVGGSTYTQTGVYQDILTSVVTGCDSIVNLDLSIRDEIRTELDEEICEDEFFAVGTSSYNQTGIYADTLTAVTGCDSIIDLNLTVYEIPITDLVEEICDGTVFPVGSSEYTTSGVYQDILTSVVTGCDSVVNLDLTVHPIEVTNLTEVVCFGDSFTVGGSTYSQSGVYQDVLTSVVTGCDSIVNLSLAVREEIRTELDEEICEDENFTVGASTYNQSGVYADTLVSVLTGCDSIVTLNLTVYEIPVISLNEEICDGETYQVGSSAYTASGTYQDILTSVVTGCDSIVNLQLTVNEVYEVTLDEDICNGDSFPVGNESFSQTGTYTVTLSSAEGCDSTVTLNLSAYPCELEYVVEPQRATCNGLSDGRFSFALTVGTPPYQYSWQSLNGTGGSGMGTIEANNLQALIDGLPAGQYRINVTDSSPFAVETSFIVTIEEPAPVDIDLLLSAYNNFNTSCDGAIDGFIDATVNGGTPPYSYYWNIGSRVEDIENLSAGEYALTVTDQNSCLDSALATLTAPQPMSVAMQAVDPACFGDEAGIITVEDVQGGVGPYLYGVDDQPLSTVPQFNNLGIGTHTVHIEDLNGCRYQQDLLIDQPEELTVDLGDNEEINLGDSVQLFAQTSYPVDFYKWTGPIPASCPDCQATFVQPLESMIFAVEVADTNGCSARDQITVFVDRQRDIYIPNVFSPNGDGQNDVFMIFAGQSAVEVKSFRVYNRWGEPMIELTSGFAPNDPDYGWDGTHRGQLMNGGVYVYMAEIEFIDGVTELFKGDVLLMR